MKRLVMNFSFAVILVLSLGFVLGADEWSVHDSGTANLNSIYCPDANTCFVAGAGGVILENIDGINFVALSSGVSANLNSIYCDDNAICWAVGASGRSIKTINGGSAWKDARTGLPLTTLNDVHFYNSQVGWVVGNMGKIFKTIKGGDAAFGSAWVQKNLPSNPQVNLNAIYFVNDNFGWIAGDTGEIFKSSDGGESWVQQTSNVNVKLNDVYFINYQKGFAVGNKPGLVGKATLLSTANGGTTWTPVTLGLNANGEDFNSVYFSDANNGFIVGSGGVVFQTIDGGATWNFLSNSIDKDLNSVFLTSEHNVFVVGNGGAIWKYGSTTAPGQTFGECSSDADCGAGEECVGGQCQVIGSIADCFSNEDCAPGQQCVSGQCVSGQNPPPGGEIGFPCSDNSDCSVELPWCFNLKCVECYANEHCDEGYECQSNECVLSLLTPDITCTETDAGFDYFIQGTVTFVGEDYTDECILVSATGEKKLTEYACNENQKESIIIDCPSGTECSDGACVFPDGSDATSLSGCVPVALNGPRIPVGTVVRLSPNSGDSSQQTGGNTGAYAEDPQGELYYCDHLTLTYKKTKSTDASCLMNYECQSNSCLSGKCTAVGEILEEQMSFLTRIWCAVSNPFDFMDKDQTGETIENNDYLKCLSEA